MWQNILAVDSQRFLDPGYRPLYLKRRLQLLQAQQNCEDFTMECSDEKDEATMIIHRPVMRNKRYLSLRVKLLKRQFGLPSDLLSLQSMSISGQGVKRARADVNENSRVEPLDDILCAHSAVERASYNGVHRVCPPSKDRGPITALKFPHNSSIFFVTSAFDGSLCIHSLDSDVSDKIFKGHDGPVVDFDLSQTDEFIVSGSVDGTLILWHTHSGCLIRKLCDHPGVSGIPTHISACRFVPSNNNLVVSIFRHTVNIINVSTGKFTGATCGLIQAKTSCVEINELGNLMWVGNDRGYIESFRLDSALNKIAKGCRHLASPNNRSVTSLSSHPNIKKLSQHPCLLATMGTDEIHLFAVTDAFGTVSPLRSVSAGTMTSLRCSVFSRIVLHRQGTCVAAGAQDGSLLFFDVERDSKPCINKLLGHSSCIVALSYSHDEKYLASCDETGQIIVWKKS